MKMLETSLTALILMGLFAIAHQHKVLFRNTSEIAFLALIFVRLYIFTDAKDVIVELEMARAALKVTNFSFEPG